MTVLLFYLLFGVFFQKEALAAGQPCCETGYSYSSATNQCISYQAYIPLPPKPSACSSTELCSGSGTGTCTEAGGGGNCCDAGFQYNDSDKKCHSSLPYVPPKDTICGPSQWCSPATKTCVVGNVTIGSSPSPFTGCTGNAINTAFGCINVEGTDFITKLLNFGIGIAGGIAMLLIIFGGFQILTSAGNPERLNEGKELVSSALTGLLMIVFSVFLLRVIGIQILGIPQFK